jgi:hypothetical protein
MSTHQAKPLIRDKFTPLSAAVALATVLLSLSACGGGGGEGGGGGPDAPHQLVTGADVDAHYVRMAQQSSEKNSRETAEAYIKQCATIRAVDAAGQLYTRPVKPLPTDRPMAMVKKETYYARQVTITYETRNELAVGPETECSFVPKKSTADTAELRSPKGLCRIDLDNKTARGTRGGCDVSEYLNATESIQNSFVEKILNAINSEIREFSSHKCTVVKTNLATQVTEACNRIPNGFIPYLLGSIAPSPMSTGLRLQDYVYAEGKKSPQEAIIYSVAEEVNENIKVSPKIFTPHMGGDFKITDAK